MSSKQVAIQVEDLGKCYQIYNSPKDRVKQMFLPKLHPLFGQNHRPYYREFWALKHLSFEVYKGETFGIIGQNGSGKSTLLQIICGILEPTKGCIDIQGRVAALLELGAGFNPEFTGKENIFLNAAVLGLSQQQIKDSYQDIVDFADIGEFIHQPVKHYSSGMYARLAFAVAIHVEPSILVVDEALSVGDEPFQRKCFAHIEKIKKAGATILFVSHSGHTIINLCDRAILLHQGERLFTGEPKRAVFYAQKLGNSDSQKQQSIIEEIKKADHDPNASQLPLDASLHPEKNQTELHDFFDINLVTESIYTYESQGALIQNPRLVNVDGAPVNQIFSGGHYTLECDVTFRNDCLGVRFYTLIRTTDGIDLAGSAFPRLGEPGMDIQGGAQFKIRFPFSCRLNPAMYFCNFAVQGEGGSLLHRIVDALAFRVMAKQPSSATGIVDLNFNPQIFSKKCEELESSL